jgi:TonB family protein
MSDLWKQWIGLTVDERYNLRQYLAHTEHSAVFLTEFPAADGRLNAAIKFISADTPGAQQQLALWNRVKQLRHPSLLPIYDAGRCRITEMDLLYVVTEFAEETLSQLLPKRALAPDEAQQMLEPVVAGLHFLHSNGMVHGHVTPSNVVAAGDSLKLTTDTAAPIGDLRELQRQRDIYDAPESAGAPLSTANDIWALGETIVAALAQHPAALPYAAGADPAIPESIPQPFQEIAQHTLRIEPSRRWSINRVAARLNPALLPAEPEPQPAAVPVEQPAPVAVAAAAAATASSSQSSGIGSLHVPAPEPLSIPLSSEPAVPLSRMPSGGASLRSQDFATRPGKPEPVESVSASEGAGWTGYIIPALLTIGLIVIVVLAVPKLLHQQSAVTNETATANSAPVTRPSLPTAQNSAPSATSDTYTPRTNTTAPRSTSVPPVSDIPANSANAAPRAARPLTPATPPPSTPAAAPKETVVSSDEGQAEVLNEVLPRIPARALSTIHGTVHVVVRVQVDPAGQVSSASLDAAGPSQYFASQSLQAARQWQFITAASNPHPATYQINFDYEQSGPKARVVPVAN